MSEKISLDESNKLHPHQWVKLYGVTANRHEYINTSQIYQLEVMVGSIQHNWWNNYVLEPVDEKEQPMSLSDALKRGRENSGT